MDKLFVYPTHLFLMVISTVAMQYNSTAALAHTETVQVPPCDYHVRWPEPVIWYKNVLHGDGRDGKKNVSVNQNITLEAASKSSAGDPSCMGWARTIVEFTHLPTRLYPVNETVGQSRGRNTQLECVGEGEPIPSMEWRFHGKTLKNNYKYHITQSSGEPNRGISTLVIRNVLRADFGKYECVGKNGEKRMSIAFELFDTEKKKVKG